MSNERILLLKEYERMKKEGGTLIEAMAWVLRALHYLLSDGLEIWTPEDELKKQGVIRNETKES